MSKQGAWQHTLKFGGGKPIVVEPSEAQLSSDAGLPAVRVFDEQIGLTAQFAAALSDARCGSQVWHSYLQMVRQRVYGILADYEDQNDHDSLRSDPIFKLIAGRGPDGRDLASQPTLSRFENAASVQCLFRLQDVLIEQFIASFEKPPARLTFDIDVWDDPTHGAQQLTFFHGYYDQYQYLPRTITCADNDQVVMLCLLFGIAHPALGAPEDLRLLCERLRQAWPDVAIELRADSGFAIPAMYEMCEQLGVQYTFGLKMNPVLQRESEALLAQAVAEYERTGDKQRLFHSFEYQAGSWPHARRTIIKCEAHAAGTNRRAVVTNRPGACVLPAATDDEYAERGESDRRGRFVVMAASHQAKNLISPRAYRESSGRAAAIRSSSAAWPVIASATIATWRICFGCICTAPHIICSCGSGGSSPILPIPNPPVICPPKRSPADAANATRTAAASAIPWAKDIPAPGARG